MQRPEAERKLTDSSSFSTAAAKERFHLTKWYLDCVTTCGDAFIAYWAELRWRRLALHYASVMLFADGRLGERSALRASAKPRLIGDTVEWSCDALNTRGIWTGAGNPLSTRQLHQHGAGKLEWTCVQPIADVAVRYGDREIIGRGYAEHLTLTLAPWELPIEELRWGRAHFRGRSIVWIDWTGTDPMCLVFVDAKEAEGARVTDDLVSTPKIQVTLSGKCVLREGSIRGTSVGNIPGVRQALSNAGLLIDECKWLSSATLHDDNKVLQGEAIHEVVRWR